MKIVRHPNIVMLHEVIIYLFIYYFFTGNYGPFLLIYLWYYCLIILIYWLIEL